MVPATPLVLRLSRCSLRTSKIVFESRSFTSTSRASSKGSLEAFEPTSSPELDALISRLEKAVFVPNAFPKKQRDLIFNPSRHEELKQTPLILLRGAEEIEVEPINRYERPRIRSSLLDAVKLMRMPEDFQNIPKLLRSLTRARYWWGFSISTKIIRTFNERGLQNLTLSCAQAYEQTSFPIGDPEMAEEAMLGAHMMAQQGNWTKDSVDLAIKYAVEIAQLLDSNSVVSNVKLFRRGARTTFDSGYVDKGMPNARPHIIGILLELSAIRSVKFNNGMNDADNQVENYATKFDASWAMNPYEWDEPEPRLAGKFSNLHNQTLARWLPAWKGIQVALKVKNLDADLKQKLKGHLAVLDQKLETVRESLAAGKTTKAGSKGRGMIFYDQLFELKV